METSRTIVVDDTVKEREISPVEKLELKRFDTVPVIDKIENRGDTQDPNVKKALEMEKEIDQEINKLVLNRAMSLQEIRARFGRIDVVTLYSGRVIRGAIVSRKASVEIITPSGLISVRANKIRNTRSI